MARPSIQERFWAKVDKSAGPDGCWLWTAGRLNGGYGSFICKLVHRISWTLANGDIPKGLCVLHRCDVRSCVNPAHLFLGTHADNTADMIRKGRWVVPPVKRGEANGSSKLTSAQVRAIRCDKRVDRIIALDYGVSGVLIASIQRGTAWKHLQ